MAPDIEAQVANPLLVQWLKEWWEQARERDTKGATTYKQAYQSMKACPLVLSHPSDASQLKGIGPKICDRLTQAMKEFCEANGLPMPKKARGSKRFSLDGLEQPEEPAPPKRQRKTGPYVPKQRSGAYAIIMALSDLPEDSIQSLSKAQLIDQAQLFCDSSFIDTGETKHYTAWNSMKTLVEKDLVHERGRPVRKYALTEEGWDIARKIRNVEKGQTLLSDNQQKAKKKRDGSEFEAITQFERSETTIRKSNAFVTLDDLGDSEGGMSGAPAQDASRPVSAFVGKGRRLGEAETVETKDESTRSKAPTVSKQNSKSKPVAPSHFVELLSSPEPPMRITSTFQDSEHQRVSGKPSERRAEAILPEALPSRSTSSRPPDTHVASAGSLPKFTPMVIPPGSFSIRLLLDNREVRLKADRDYIANQLTEKGTEVIQKKEGEQNDVRTLPLGDICWVARLHDKHFLSRYGEEGNEIMLDWIVERKRYDDLVSSIIDKRFSEQKFRLGKSGVKNVTYLIEETNLSKERALQFDDQIKSAFAGTQVVNGYFVQRTPKIDHSISYLYRLTKLLKSLYENKPLHIIPSSVLTSTNYLPMLNHLRTHESHRNTNYNITFSTFSAIVSKSDSLTLRDVFLKMLMCMRGVSGEKAIAIQKAWPTPRAFVEAYERCETDKQKEAMLEKGVTGLIGRNAIKGALSAKVADIWARE